MNLALAAAICLTLVLAGEVLRRSYPASALSWVLPWSSGSVVLGLAIASA